MGQPLCCQAAGQHVPTSYVWILGARSLIALEAAAFVVVRPGKNASSPFSSAL
jgi:hypothetical protein